MAVSRAKVYTDPKKYVLNIAIETNVKAKPYKASRRMSLGRRYLLLTESSITTIAWRRNIPKIQICTNWKRFRVRFTATFSSENDRMSHRADAPIIIVVLTIPTLRNAVFAV